MPTLINATNRPKVMRITAGINVDRIQQLAVQAAGADRQEQCHAFVCLLAYELRGSATEITASLLDLIEPANAHHQRITFLIKTAFQRVDQDVEQHGTVSGGTVEFVRQVKDLIQ